MLKSLRARRSGDGRKGQADSAETLSARLSELIDANRKDRSLEQEREILMLRHRLGAQLVAADRPAPKDVQREFGALDEEGLASADAADLDGALVRGGILEHGYVLVRGMVERDEALSFADLIEAAFRARADGGAPGLYEEFKPERPYGPVPGRAWIEMGGGLLAADSPELSFELFDLFERIGLRSVVSEFLGEPATVSVQKTTLRRADPAPAGGWHQDGSFMGTTRPLNLWIALSDCGVDAPGLEFVPARIDQLLETAGDGSGIENTERPDTDRVTVHDVLIGTTTAEDAAGAHGVVRPEFRAGDVMLFDDVFLHRTGSDENMPKPRYAVESWFFGASGFPGDYVPLAY
jgi:hypothetical protein